MPLVSIVPLLRRAQAGRYAVPLFLTPEMLAAEGTVAALEDLGAPAAVGVYAPWIERPTARALSAYLVALAEGARVPVALMLDHGTTLEQCARAIRYGFSDVMFDGSSLPYEENVAATRTVVRMAHAAGVGVEAELGHVGTGAEYQEMGAQRVGFTDPVRWPPTWRRRGWTSSRWPLVRRTGSTAGSRTWISPSSATCGAAPTSPWRCTAGRGSRRSSSAGRSPRG